MIRRTITWALACLLAVPAPRAEPAPAERFFARPAMLAAQLSPSGKHLAFIAAQGEARLGLFVLDLADGGVVQNLVQFDDADVQRVDWVGDETLLFSVVDLQSASGWSYREGPGLFSVARSGGKPRELVQRRSRRAVEQRAGRNQMALDVRHQLLDLPYDKGNEVLMGRWDASGLTPLWLNVRSGVTRAYGVAAPAGGEPIAWWFDSRGDARVTLLSDGAKNLLFWRAPGEEAWQLLDRRDALKPPFEIAHVDDKGGLFVRAPRGEAGERVLTRYDFAIRAPAAQALAAVPGFDFQGRFLQTADGPLGLRFDAERQRTVWISESLQTLQAQADERFPDRTNQLECRRCVQADEVVLLFSFSDRDPGQYWLIEQGGQRWRALARVQPGIDPAAMGRLSLHRVPARDGRSLPVWLTQPAKGDGPRPAVVLVHGGPWVRGVSWRWSAMAQFLASRGYLVIQPEFRGSLGYGDGHWQAGFKQWGLAMQNDVADALQWAQQQGLASEQACIAGGSYGGYSTLIGLIQHPEQYRCGIAWAAVADLRLFLEGSLWVGDDISPQARSQGLPRLVGSIKTDAAQLEATSPVLQAARIKAPLLLIHGSDDLRVPLAHAERMRDALQAAGRPPEWVVYRDEGHGWRLPRNQADFAQRMERFLAEHLGQR